MGKAPPPLPGKAGPGGRPPPPPIPFTKQNNAPYKAIPPSIQQQAESAEALPLGRRLHWKPLRNVDDTIWEKLRGGESEDQDGDDSSSLDLDFRDMQSVFVSSEKTTSNPGLSRSGTSGIPDSQVITLLEAKRAQNIGVVMARIPVESVTGTLASLDLKEKLSAEVFERLKTVLPTDEEVTCFNQYKGDLDRLRDIERKIFHLFKLPRLAARIKFCLIDLQLPNLCNEVKTEIELLRNCVSEIRASSKLRKLLHSVLMLGNYVNSVTSVKGFSIESLSKLVEFKAQSDPNITSLHFLAARLLKNDPQLVTDLYSSDLPSLKPASKIASESVIQTIATIKRDPELVRHEITHHGSLYTSDALGRLEQFVEQTEPLVDKLCGEWTLCERELIEIRKFFGEDPRKLSADEFFNHLRVFLDHLTLIHADLKRRPKKFAKILATDEIESKDVMIKLK